MMETARDQLNRPAITALLIALILLLAASFNATAQHHGGQNKIVVRKADCRNFYLRPSGTRDNDTIRINELSRPIALMPWLTNCNENQTFRIVSMDISLNNDPPATFTTPLIPANRFRPNVPGRLTISSCIIEINRPGQTQTEYFLLPDQVIFIVSD